MNSGAVPRSTFVTVLAWLGIVLGTIGMLATGLQWLIVRFTMPMSFEALLADPSMAETPATIQWMFRHFEALILANLVAVAALLAGSIGLLRRRNWGRLAIVVLLALGIASHVAGVGVQYVVMEQVSRIDPGPQAPVDFEQQFALVRTFVVGFSALFALLFVALYAWLIRKLVSPAIRREFGVG
jgi:hypothetical protein